MSLVVNGELSDKRTADFKKLSEYICRLYVILRPGRLVISAELAATAGLIEGPNGEEFDVELAIEAIADQAIRPALN